MKNRLIKTILFSVLFIFCQVVAFALAKVATAIQLLYPLHLFKGDEIASIYTHILFDLIALIVAIYMIPINEEDYYNERD